MSRFPAASIASSDSMQTAITSMATYGNRIYASDRMSNLAVLDEDTGAVLERVENIAIYIHQLAMDAHGDLYTASVYPEHAGEKRGAEGPSHRRWTRTA
jgi:hypothetical protein